MISVQKFKKEEGSELDVAIKYYSIISSLHKLNLPQRQIELLAFCAVRGTITPLPARQEFIKLFNSSSNSIANMKGELVKKRLMVKVKDMYRVNPLILPDFSNKLILQITLDVKEERDDS